MWTKPLEIAGFDHRTPRPIALLGPRGVGKTVTLGEAANMAGRKLSWPTVHVEAKPGGFLRDLVNRLVGVAQLLEGEAPAPSRRKRSRLSGGTVTGQAFGVGLGGGVHFDTSDTAAAPAEQLEDVLRHAAELAAGRDAGLLLTLDELQTAAPEEVSALAAVLQEHVLDNWLLVVVVAALPSLRNTRGRRKLPTYLERAEWHDMGPLDRADAKRALTEPASQAGRCLTVQAANELLDLCGGYPYAIQVAGHFSWRASTGADEINAQHVAAARPRIIEGLEQLFRSRWEDASEKRRDTSSHSRVWPWIGGQPAVRSQPISAQAPRSCPTCEIGSSRRARSTPPQTASCISLRPAWANGFASEPIETESPRAHLHVR